ncbi:hypothetical protein CVS40_5377 [Lucilia cuprina]|nr:hypothetical protein CVS40_5377 [Lucilia cuprina]
MDAADVCVWQHFFSKQNCSLTDCLTTTTLGYIHTNNAQQRSNNHKNNNNTSSSMGICLNSYLESSKGK